MLFPDREGPTFLSLFVFSAVAQSWHLASPSYLLFCGGGEGAFCSSNMEYFSGAKKPSFGGAEERRRVQK